MDENRFTYEIILVDDGSKDGSWDMIVKLKESNPFIKGHQIQA
jgi:glycosyltransferase involved in cell wall biosynthesis